MLKVLWLRTHVLSCCLFFLLSAPIGAVADEPPKAERSTISVSGSAEINVAPDQMIVRGSIESREKTIGEASAANAKLVESMRAALKAMEISQNDISAERISIEAITDSPKRWSSKAKLQVVQSNAPAPNSSNPFGDVGTGDTNKLRKPVGYSVTRHFEITISDLKSYEKLYTALVESGVTRVDQGILRTTKLRKYRDQARLEAMKAAREKATAMAGVLNANLAGVKSIRESSSNSSDPFQNPFFGSAPDANSPAGMMKVSAAVSVDFYLGNTEFAEGK